LECPVGYIKNEIERTCVSCSVNDVSNQNCRDIVSAKLVADYNNVNLAHIVFTAPV
jgi:hypothetical protein